MRKRWKNFFQRTLVVPTGSKFVRDAKITKHRLDKTGDPVLIMTLTIGDGDNNEQLKFAIHQGLAWQMVRQIRKAIGFSESELDAARWIGRYSGGDV